MYCQTNVQISTLCQHWPIIFFNVVSTLFCLYIVLPEQDISGLMFVRVDVSMHKVEFNSTLLLTAGKNNFIFSFIKFFLHQPLHDFVFL